MTTLAMDAFDQYGSGAVGVANMLDGPWASITSLITVGVPSWGAITGPYALIKGLGISPNGGARRVITQGTQDHIFFSFRYGLPYLPVGNGASGGTSILATADGGNTKHCFLVVESTGVVSLYAASSNTYGPCPASSPLVSTSLPVVKANNSHFFECELQISTGTFVMRIDDPVGTGTPAINASGLTFASANPVGQYELLSNYNYDSVSGSALDDWFLRNASGSVNNGFLGDYRVTYLPEIANRTSQGWTPSYIYKFGNGVLSNRPNSNTGFSVPAATYSDLGGGDFTIEGWWRFETLPTGSNFAQLAGKWDATNNKRSWQLALCGPTLNNGNFIFQTSTDGTAGTVVQSIAYPWVPNKNVWYHIAVVRSSGQDLLFVNGGQLGVAIADSATYYAGSEPLSFGCQVEGSTSPITGSAFTGYMDETRLTVGYARYTASFTAPVAAFPRGIADPQWADVAFIAGYDSSLADESSHLATITGYNGVLQITPNDGPQLGAYSTINELIPNDDNFISAPLLPASGIFTLTANPSNNDSVTVATLDGTVAAKYLFKTALGTADETTASNEKSVANTGSTSSNTISWGAVTGATGYKIYRGTSSGAENVEYTVGNVTSFVDTGAAGTSASPPGSQITAIVAPVQANISGSTMGGTLAAATYYYKVTAITTGFQVLIGASIAASLTNLLNAINAGTGSGTLYGTGTTANNDVTATALPSPQLEVIANLAGTAGNSLASTASITGGGSWANTTLTDGVDIPGYSEFTVAHPPPQTTLIAAAEVLYRALKSDAGTCTMKSSFISPLGGVLDGAINSLTVSSNYYDDIFELDPSTSGPITPTTVINGGIRFTRVT